MNPFGLMNLYPSGMGGGMGNGMGRPPYPRTPGPQPFQHSPLTVPDDVPTQMPQPNGQTGPNGRPPTTGGPLPKAGGNSSPPSLPPLPPFQYQPPQQQPPSFPQIPQPPSLPSLGGGNPNINWSLFGGGPDPVAHPGGGNVQSRTYQPPAPPPIDMSLFGGGPDPIARGPVIPPSALFHQGGGMGYDSRIASRANPLLAALQGFR